MHTLKIRLLHGNFKTLKKGPFLGPLQTFFGKHCDEKMYHENVTFMRCLLFMIALLRGGIVNKSVLIQREVVY